MRAGPFDYVNVYLIGSEIYGPQDYLVVTSGTVSDFSSILLDLNSDFHYMGCQTKIMLTILITFAC